jgi:membrane protease YdiL (CAAX protease family)
MLLAAADIAVTSAAPSATTAVWLVLTALAVLASAAVMAVILGRLRAGLQVIAPRPHAPVSWNGFDVLQVLLIHFLVLAVGLTGFRLQDDADKLIALSVFANLATTAFAIAYLSLRGASLADLGLASPRPAADLLIAIAGVALLVAPLLTMSVLLNAIVPYKHPLINFMHTHRDLWSIGTVVASAVVAAPLWEEFFFRRVLQGWLEKKLPADDGRVAVVLASALFAAAHVNQGLAFLPLFPLALVLGAIVRRTGSIVPCILLHALFNAVSVALLLWQTAAAARPAG